MQHLDVLIKESVAVCSLIWSKLEKLCSTNNQRLIDYGGNLWSKNLFSIYDAFTDIQALDTITEEDFLLIEKDGETFRCLSTAEEGK